MSDFEVGDSYYDVLGIPSESTQEEIHNAWIARTKEVHADKTGDSERYEYLLDAGKVLKDEQKRTAYDNLGHDTFTERYGNRGNAKPIDPDDLTAPSTNTTTTENDKASSDTTSSSDTTGRAQTNTTDRTRGAQDHTQTSSRTDTNNTDPGQTSTATNTHTTSTTETTSTETQTANTTSSDAVESTSASDTVKRWISFIFISPMVSFPVTSRVTAIAMSIISILAISQELDIAGSGIDLFAGIILTGALFLTIRWVPDYVGAQYPRESSILSEIRLSALGALAIIALAISSLSSFSIVQTITFSNIIIISMLLLLVSITVMFAVFGIGLSFVGILSGSSDRSIIKPVVIWSAILGAILGTGFTVSVTGQPREALLVELLGISTYPWEFASLVPEYILHWPMVITVMLSLIVAAGSIGVFIIGTLLLLHTPQRHAYQSLAIRPSAWEIAASVPIHILVWMSLHQPVLDTPLFQPYANSLVIVDGGVFDFVLLPFCIVFTAFTIKDIIEPRYTDWRE